MGSISIREFIRWVPDEASEPTSTLVVTSPGRRFVDIRVNRPDTAKDGRYPGGQERITMGQLDWAIAGTSSSWPVGDGPVTHGQWKHWIDNRTTQTDDLADEGDNYPQEDGTTLEKGTMMNPATGKVTEYEELWRTIEPRPVDSNGVRSVVLQLEREKTKGQVTLLGHLCQGLLRKGDQITAERWEWAEANSWQRTVVVGDDELPCARILGETSPMLHVGAIITVGDDTWKVIESE